MEKNNRELTQLEYLINLRAISYSKTKCWIYLSLKQKLTFIAVMHVMNDFQKAGRNSVIITELIQESKKRLDASAQYFKKKMGQKIGNSFSKEVIRSVIYLCFPVYLNVVQHGRPKIISLTQKSKDFIDWERKKSIVKSGKKVWNWRLWLKKIRLNFLEVSPPVKNNIKNLSEKAVQNN